MDSGRLSCSLRILGSVDERGNGWHLPCRVSGPAGDVPVDPHRDRVGYRVGHDDPTPYRSVVRTPTVPVRAVRCAWTLRYSSSLTVHVPAGQPTGPRDTYE